MNVSITSDETTTQISTKQTIDNVTSTDEVISKMPTQATDDATLTGEITTETSSGQTELNTDDITFTTDEIITAISTRQNTDDMNSTN